MAHRPAETIGHLANVPLPLPQDDDSATPSSNVSEIFDREPKPFDGSAKWQLDVHGNWQRYPSLESATSTGISSICSSDATNDKHLVFETGALPSSKKRMADGMIKSDIRRTSGSSIIGSSRRLFPNSFSNAAVTLKSESSTEPKKRRGRPPKQKAPQAHFSLKARRASEVFSIGSDVKPRSSIPARLKVEEYASQCLEAAYASRLDPFALHTGEYKLLESVIMSAEVTIYLNIRNAILRLWCQNPLVSVTAEEAAGCAKEARFFGLARVAYEWLVRNGYINFGCVEVPQNPTSLKEARKNARQRTIVVVGAGVSGLTTARQLDGLIAQAADHWCDIGEKPPRIVLLEGRKRIGGRVYSKPLRSQVKGSLPDDLRNTAEMGAMIVTGFERGNPLDTVIRAQLGMRYHSMTDELTIYDTDGSPVDEEQDNMVTKLYTDISDRAGEFRAVHQKRPTMAGDQDLISRCRDPIPNGFATFQLEPLFDPAGALKQYHKPTFKRGRRLNAPPGTEKLTGRTQVVENSSINGSAARAAEEMGFELADGVSRKATLSLHHQARSVAHPTLGAVMDEAIDQYQQIIDLTPQDMRLLNWHHANLEYANAAPVSWLSLSGHDQDNGNEFEGAHSTIIGGYTQLPRGLMSLPSKLDVRFDKSVESIHYDHQKEDGAAVTTKVVCTDGEVIEADEVVMTVPLGILKAHVVDFDPPLPDWKQGAIERMGFGLLNKIILLYDKPFWDDSRDMFGLLNEAEEEDSLEPAHYERRRGRFYLVWNCSSICGRPLLVALLAGHAAHDAETTSTDVLLDEINERFRKTFGPVPIPSPKEVIVTRWKSDKFTRGTYSFVGARTQPDDYDTMAKPVGNLHFAGEATCGTHPATVHGAFLSGLRVAAEVMDAIVGPVDVPRPLVQSTVRQSIPLSTKEQPTTHRKFVQSVPQPSTLSQWGSLTLTARQPSPFLPLQPPPPQIPTTIAPLRAGSVGTSDTTLKAATTVPDPIARRPSWQLEPARPPSQSVVATDPTFFASATFDAASLDPEISILSAISGQIGLRPERPKRGGVNPFLLYTKDMMEKVKKWCEGEEEERSAGAGASAIGKSKAGRNAIRTKLGQWWKALPDEEKKPYQLEARKKQDEADTARKIYEVKVQEWDRKAAQIRRDHIRDNPWPSGMNEAKPGYAVLDGVGVSKRKTNVSTNVALDFRMS